MATCRWLGHAEAVAEVQTSAISGTWANNDSVTWTINGKNVTSTLTTEGNTYSDILNTFAAALNASTIPEYEEVTWSNHANTHLKGTGDTAGVPFTITDSVTTGGDGDMGAWAINTAASGPYTANTADNWSTGATPTNTDDVVFENSDKDCLYQLDALSGIKPSSLTIKQSYTGKIGLPFTNEDGGSADTDQYQEYRERYLKMGPTTVGIGDGDGSGSGRIMLDFSADDAAITVYDKGTRQETGVPCVLLKGTNASNSLTVVKGDVGCALYDGESMNLSGGLKVGYETSVGSDSDVVLGGGLTLVDVDMSGGELWAEDNITNCVMHAGTLYLGGSATLGDLDMYGGKLISKSTGTVTTADVFDGATYDRSQTLGSQTITNLNLYTGAKYLDPYGNVTETNGIDLEGCTLSDVTITKPPHRTVTFSTI